MSKVKKLKIRINKDFITYKEGQEISVDSIDGIPLDKFWRDRLKDSKFDNCVSVVKKTRKPAKKQQEIENDNAS